MSTKKPKSPIPVAEAESWAKSAAKKTRTAKLTTAQLQTIIASFLSLPLQQNNRAQPILSPSATSNVSPLTSNLPSPPSLSALARFHELSHTDRSDHGVYYTPPAVATLMAQAALDQWRKTHPSAPIQNLTILDPAAGTGDLLLAARNLLPANFSGRLIAVDTDPTALLIAHARLLENHPHLANHILTLNDSGLTPTLTTTIGQADILLLNPPYVPAYSRRSRKTQLLSDDHKKQRPDGRINLFTRFIQAIGALTKPDGIACTITPDTLAFADSYARDREHLAHRFPSQRWLLIEKRLFNAAVQNVIGLFGSGQPESFAAQTSHVPSNVQSIPWIPGPAPSSASIIFYKHPIEPLLQSTIANLTGPLLSDIFHVKDGINPGPAHMRAKLIAPLPPLNDNDSGLPSPLPDARRKTHDAGPPLPSSDPGLETLDSGPLPDARRKTQDAGLPLPSSDPGLGTLDSGPPLFLPSPLLAGRDIAPWGFALTPPTLGIRYDPALISRTDSKAGTSLRNPAIFQSPKLVSRQTANMPIVGIDLIHNHYTSNSVHNIRAINPAHAPLLWGLMAYLNSPIIRLYYALSGGETRATLPQVRIAWLNRVPLPPDWQTLFSALVPHAQSLASESQPNPHTLTKIHQLICSHLNLSDPASITHAYQTRFNKPVPKSDQTPDPRP